MHFTPILAVIGLLESYGQILKKMFFFLDCIKDKKKRSTARVCIPYTRHGVNYMAVHQGAEMTLCCHRYTRSTVCPSGSNCCNVYHLLCCLQIMGVFYDRHASCMQSVDAGLSDIDALPVDAAVHAGRVSCRS